MTTVHDMPPDACPICGKRVECASNLVDGDKPGEGDFSICIDCLFISRWKPDTNAGGLRLAPLVTQVDRDEAFETFTKAFPHLRVYRAGRGGREHEGLAILYPRAGRGPAN